MAVLDFLLRRRSSPKAPDAEPLLHRLTARVPRDGAPGLLPSGDPAVDEEERQLAQRNAAELHLLRRGSSLWLGQSRRLAAIASSARRRDPDELREAVAGVEPWELPSLLEALAQRRDLPPSRLAEVARIAASRAADFRGLAAALALITPGVSAEDLPLLLVAGRSSVLSGVCALAIEGLPSEAIDPALLSLARITQGLGAALTLERLAIRHVEEPTLLAPLLPDALSLAAAIPDPLDRAYAAVPLLEVAGPDLLDDHPALATSVAACLDATSRGGWNGGPGPGLGRLPNASHLAHALLIRPDLPEEARRAVAHAVLDARPIPTGPIRLAAEDLLRAAP